jgi:dolichol-phosphate mannosyltransferase
MLEALGDYYQKHQTLFRRFIKFCLVGFTNSLVDFLLYWFFTRLVGWPYLLANAAAVIIAITWSFVLNTFWTWQQDLSWPKYKKFFLVNGLGALWQCLLLYCLVGWLDWPDLGAKVLAIIFVTLWNFILNQLLVFKAAT